MIGYWLDEAHRALRAAGGAAERTEASGAAAVHAALAGRADVLTGLIRVTDLLGGGRPAEGPPTREAASRILGRPGPALTRLYIGLQTAAATGLQFAMSEDPADAVTVPLRRTADAVGVIGDILASHVPPRQRPRTPEGVAIRAGGGVRGALGDIARLVTDVVALDSQLPGWVARGEQPMAAAYRAMEDMARWSNASQLAAVAGELIADAAEQPGLIRLLDLAGSPLESTPAVTTPVEAAARLSVARAWLFQNPGRVGVVHLQLATQLGLALHLLDDDADPDQRQIWRQAALNAADLRGVPESGLARNTAGELAEVLRWARSQLRADSAAGEGHTGRFAHELPMLAGTLHAGLRQVTRSGDLFVRDDVLRRPAGKLIYMASKRWRPVSRDDDVVRDLSRLLFRAAGPAKPAGVSAAAQGFPQPPRPGAASTVEAPARLNLPPSASRHRGRSSRSRP